MRQACSLCCWPASHLACRLPPAARQVYASFTPPGNLTDLRPENLAGWSDTISSFFDASA